MDLVVGGLDDEALLLDLLNTTPAVDGVPRDDLADQRAARAWMRERGIAPTKAELASLLDARSLLQDVVRGDARPAALQRFLGGVRLRPCANPECRLFLIDRSKPNTASWCSMAICGNRMKARRHYRRARTTDE
jgi:predicted RNA-binding Zn ribbon-like protein